MATAIEPSDQSSKPPSNVKDRLPDYERTFLPFEPLSHSTIAPIFRKPPRKRTLNLIESTPMGASSEDTKLTSSSIFKRHACKRGRRPPRVRDVVASIQGRSDGSISIADLSIPGGLLQPCDYLQAVSCKFLQFAEDVRPPYYGTFTKIDSIQQVSQVGRNPLRRRIKALNYDYDSEAEWEEPGEGEDLLSEEEDVESNDGADDMDGFLDDEGETVKRQQISSDLEAISSNLCFENPHGKVRWHHDASGALKEEMKGYRLELILGMLVFHRSRWSC